MSVLVEGLTMVILKRELDAHYPRGSEAFVEAACRLEPPPRYACDDGRLLNLSFYGARHAAPTLDLLFAGLGLLGEPDAYAFVDQELGPASSCGWLEWARDREGYACTWLAGMDPGELATDLSWSPERSRGLVRRDPTTESVRLVPLTQGGGLASWLDLETGKELIGVADAPGATKSNQQEQGFLGDAALEPLMCPGAAQAEEVSPGQSGTACENGVEERAATLRTRMIEILDAEALRYRVCGPDWIEVPFTGDSASISVRMAAAANGKFVRLYSTSDVRVPESHRSAACELLTRANWGLPIGDFEMDIGDGELVFKSTLFVGETGALAQEQLAEAIRASVCLFDRYFPALMRVVYGGVTPAEAIAEVEE